MLMPNLPSSDKTLVIVVKNYAKKVDFEEFWSCPILFDFFTMFQIFCSGFPMFVLPGKVSEECISVLKQESHISYKKKEIKTTIFKNPIQKYINFIISKKKIPSTKGRSM